MYDSLRSKDKKVFKSLKNEIERQVTGIELIASENYVSEAVLDAMGSIFTNKYSEGYSRKRYYKGNEFIDDVEELAIHRAKELFGAEHVNVQPYSGSPANLAVHYALLEPGDRTLGMSLDAGGHLTHGYKVSFSGRYYKSENYGVDNSGYIDFDEVRKIAKKWKPKMIWVGASAYPRIIDFKEFRKVADEVGAYMVADIAHIAGLIVGGEHPSPIGIADIVTTTTHKTLRGPRGAMIMCNNEYAEKIDKAVFPGLQGGPHNHTTAAIAVSLKEASLVKFNKYAAQVVKNANKLAEELIDRGYKLVSGGTDNHLMLVDVTVISDEMSGELASTTLEKVNISVNKNAIPNDPRKPWDPSGIRIGTPAITTRGLKERDMVVVAELIDKALKSKSDPDLKKIRKEVSDFISKFPIPGSSN